MGILGYTEKFFGKLDFGCLRPVWLYKTFVMSTRHDKDRHGRGVERDYWQTELQERNSRMRKLIIVLLWSLFTAGVLYGALDKEVGLIHAGPWAATGMAFLGIAAIRFAQERSEQAEARS